MQSFEIVVTTLKGLEEVLAAEIEKIGGTEIEILNRAVRFNGNLELLYKANMALRTALRILMPIDDFIAENESELYENALAFPWENVFDLNQRFAVEATISGYNFSHSKYVALKVKDAIADRFRHATGQRPDVDTTDPQIKINVHINHDEVTVSLDSSGKSLDKRGYRTQANEAPINEVLAAGIIYLTAWTPTLPFYDSMAGSGTFSIEAALIGTETAPNLNRNFSFENWWNFDQALFEATKTQLISAIKNPEMAIYASDILAQNLPIIQANAKRAGIEDSIKVKRSDFFFSEAQNETGILILNPPYGERMQIDQINAFYKQMGDTFKQKYAGFDAWVISSNLEALKYLGLKADQKIDLSNGGLDARLNKYRLYKGKDTDENE